MNDYSRLSHQRYKDQLGLSDSDALDRVKEDHASFVDAFGRQDEFFERTDMQVAAFLLGATLVTADKHMAWYPWASLTDEITSVMDLKLSASQPKDYVLSLFADWDFYDPPSGFQDLPTNMLLKDFLRQLRKVEPVLIPTRCPAGLFGISDETWGFDASDITLFRPIEDVRHIYGMFQWYDAVASSTPGRLPLRLSRSRWQSCASKARSLASWLAHHDKVTGFVWFCNALLASQRACTNRLAELGQSVPSTAKLQAMLSSDDPLEQVQGCRGCLVLVANHISSSTDDAKAVDVFLDVAPRERLSGLAQNCLHRIVERASAAGSPLGPLMLHCYSMPLHGLEDAVFEVICEMLFLDAKLCWERGVRVILGEWHPLEDQGDSPDPRWAPGLATSENKTVSNDDPAGGHEDSDDARDGPAQQSSTEAGSKTCIGLVHWETFCQARAQQKDTMTIALGSRPDIPFYEAFRSSSPGCLDTPPEYKVFGVWVPLDHERFGVADIGAIVVDEDKANAFVV
ncbi:hypothetical protein A1O7_08953 [Cladophialophora yegresii CBS 114405]|uniref:Heterokaryon incompatibility domain-containing protein n=1 Tax=Cladophialophora yegresii CBS 114405 TaxID=1182544 RepID=W9VK04_9EURO|nr:uncharacterized protein A1O7_08953 [Cladophialophora yegresii CBS 114405]EXJ56022.1 hypothetical protein A1O7_08953 [Cladophialophora yegresii CBS 114405]